MKTSLPSTWRACYSCFPLHVSLTLYGLLCGRLDFPPSRLDCHVHSSCSKKLKLSKASSRFMIPHPYHLVPRRLFFFSGNGRYSALRVAIIYLFLWCLIELHVIASINRYCRNNRFGYNPCRTHGRHWNFVACIRAVTHEHRTAPLLCLPTPAAAFLRPLRRPWSTGVPGQHSWTHYRNLANAPAPNSIETGVRTGLPGLVYSRVTLTGGDVLLDDDRR